MCYIYDAKLTLRSKGLLLLLLTYSGTARELPLLAVVKHFSLKNGSIDMRPLTVLSFHGYVKIRRLSTGDLIIYNIVDSISYI